MCFDVQYRFDVIDKKCLELKKEKVTLNSRQTVIRDFLHSSSDIEQPVDL